MIGAMDSRKFFLSVFYLFALPSICYAGKPHFRGRQVPVTNVTTADVEASLQSTLDVLLRGGNGIAAQRLANVEAQLWPTFQALPKNEMGRLAPKAVRYAVHNYFAKEHGWLIQGLNPNTMQATVSEVHEVSILQDKAPALVEALLEARRANHGLSLSDLVVMVASLEALIFDESLTLLQSAYTLNGQSTAEAIEEQSLDQVLTSYLIIFGSGNIAPGGKMDAETHKALRLMAEQDALTPHMLDFENDAVRNFRYARLYAENPFRPLRYSFQTASEIVETLAHGYGKWQNTECGHMKQELMMLDAQGTGSIPLSIFYGEKDDGDYLFAESADYLRSIGALDESRPKSPKVRIANYLYGPSNCIVTSSYYSVCCLNECEALMNSLEGNVQAPTASPKLLLDLVSNNLSSASVDAPRALSSSLRSKLHIIAEKNGGEVPLHGRLFSQWMHLAFPNECPFPYNVKDAKALMTDHWKGRTAVATEKERSKHVEAANTSSQSYFRTAEALEPFWSEEELLPLLEDPPRSIMSRTGDVLRVLTHVATLLVLIRIVMAAFRAASIGLSAETLGLKAKAKKEDAALPW